MIGWEREIFMGDSREQRKDLWADREEKGTADKQVWEERSELEVWWEGRASQKRGEKCEEKKRQECKASLRDVDGRRKRDVLGWMRAKETRGDKVSGGGGGSGATEREDDGG